MVSSGDNTLLDYALNKLATPVVAAHVSCCNRPNANNLPNLWKENVGPLMEFLNTAGQGIFGVVSAVDGDRLPEATAVLEAGHQPPVELAVSAQGRSAHKFVFSVFTSLVFDFCVFSHYVFIIRNSIAVWIKRR